MFPTGATPRSATTPPSPAPGKLGLKSRRQTLQPRRAPRTRQRSDFARPPGSPAPLPSRPETPGANQSVAELWVVESRARDPPLFVAAANGRIRNIGGCPGDSVICHRITFENGTWNEATATAAPSSPRPRPSRRRSSSRSSSPRRPRRTERLRSHEAGRPKVGSQSCGALFPRPACSQSVPVSGAGTRGRGRVELLPLEPVDRGRPSPSRLPGELPGRNAAAFASRCALAAAPGAHVPARSRFCSAPGHIWRRRNAWSLAGTACSFRQHELSFSSLPRPLRSLHAPCSYLPRVEVGVKLCGKIQVAFLGNCRAGSSLCNSPAGRSVRAQGSGRRSGNPSKPHRLGHGSRRGSSGCPLLRGVCCVSLISGTARKRNSSRRSPLARPAAAGSMEKAALSGR